MIFGNSRSMVIIHVLQLNRCNFSIPALTKLNMLNTALCNLFLTISLFTFFFINFLTLKGTWNQEFLMELVVGKQLHIILSRHDLH